MRCSGFSSFYICISLFSCFSLVGQITFSINAGNPNFPFPQFKGYDGAPNPLANQNPVGVPHAELEQRTRDGYQVLIGNDNSNGVYGPITANGVRYILPNQGNEICEAFNGIFKRDYGYES